MRPYIKLIGILVITIICALSYLIQAQENPLTQPVPQEKTYQLTASLKEGNKFEISQVQKWEGKLIIKTELEQKYPFLKSIQNNYSEVILSAKEGTINSERTYTLSRIKINIPTTIPEKGIKDEATSLQGKQLALEIKDNQLTATKILAKQNNVVLKNDLPYVTSFTEYNLLLPQAPVKPGDSWQITNAELGKVVFKEDYDEKLCSVEGKATLDAITTYKDLNSARVFVNLKITHKANETTPALSVELKGTYYYALDKNVITSLDLKGQFTLDKEIKLADKSLVKINAAGEIIITSQVTPIEK